LLFGAELSSQAINFFHLTHQGKTHPLDLFFGKRAGVDAPERLALQQFVQELDDGEDELSESAFWQDRVAASATGPSRTSLLTQMLR
jgi:hypothetical protein